MDQIDEKIASKISKTIGLFFFFPNLFSDLGHEYVNTNTPNLCLLLQSRYAPATPIFSVPNGLDAVLS